MKTDGRCSAVKANSNGNGDVTRENGVATQVHAQRSIADSLYLGQNYTNIARIRGESPRLENLGDDLFDTSADDSSVAVHDDLAAQDAADISCIRFEVDEYCLF